MMSSIIAQLLRGWESCKIRYTMWKFHDFSVTQILREINSVKSRSSKNAVFAIFAAWIFVYLVTFSL